MAVPGVERVAPELAGGGEIVGRDAGDVGGAELFIELKQFWMRPGVGGIGGDKDGHVADKADAAAVGIGAQLLPLMEEEELAEFVHIDLAREVVSGLFDGRGIKGAVLGGPFVPGDTAMALLQ